MAWSWCTELLVDHARNVVELCTRGTVFKRHQVFETIGNTIGSLHNVKEHRVLASRIQKSFNIAVNRLASITNADKTLVRDCVVLALALHDVGKSNSMFQSLLEKALNSKSEHRCRVSRESIRSKISDVVHQLEEYHSSDTDRKTINDLADTVLQTIDKLKFGCPLNARVCPRTFVFELYRRVSTSLTKNRYLVRKFFELLLRELSSVCRCSVKPSLKGHEIPSTYILFTIIYRLLRRLRSTYSIDAKSRKLLASLLSISVLLHHYASRDLESAIERLAAASNIPMIVLDETLIENSRKIVDNIMELLECKQFRDEVVRAIDELHSSAKTSSQSIYVPTLIGMLLDEDIKPLTKLYVIPLEPLCLADSYTSYLGRGVGTPPSIIKQFFFS